MRMILRPARRASGLLRNYISLSGAAIVVASCISILFFFVAESFGSRDNPYLGMFTYIIFPVFLVAGLVVMGIGALRERRRRIHEGESEIAPYPTFDLNDPAKRRRFFVFAAVSLIFIFVSLMGSYRAYEYMDSVEFCGQACHTPMNPEFTAYKVSPHARVRCTECHVGSGAEWYLRAKFSGVRRLYAELLNNYSRPIPSPVHDLRPAKDTCEQCHWPKKFFGSRLKTFSHFGYDETNTQRDFRLLINIGGGDETTGPVTGIHWHMNLANQITFVSTDDQRQVIPWVRLKDGNGKVTDYIADGAALTSDEIEHATKRQMDCTDCHNRPTHIFLSPDRAVNESLAAGRLDASLPYLKRQAVELLSKSYASKGEAMRAIASGLSDYYRANHADLYLAKQGSINQAVAEIQRIFDTYFFPEMKTDWQAHPDNIGHFNTEGCFRCHDGRHTSSDGKVIRKDCDLCHTMLDQKEEGAAVALENGAFRHPVNLGNVERFKCAECHSGKGLSFKHPVDLGDISQFKCSACHTGINYLNGPQSKSK